MPSKTVLCFLCGKYSKIPIRDRPTRINIQNIIDSAKHRLLNKCCGKYEKCEQWSKCKVEDLIGMSYHRSCYKDFIRSDLSKSAVKEIKLDDFVSNYIEYNVIRSSRCIDIKTITSEYMSEVSNAVESTIKKKVKSYLQNRSDILILKPLLTNQSEVVVSKRNVETVFFTYYDNKSADENDFDTLGEAFEKARNMLLVEPEWQFEGDFKTFKVNDRILTLFKILIGGKNPHSSKTSFIDRAAMLLVQFTEELMLSERQAKYSSHDIRHRKETPLSVGVAIDTHKNFRSKKLVTRLNELGVAIPYRKLLQIENDIALSIEKIEDETGGFAAPQWLRLSTFMCFAIDNVDFNEATYSGKNSLHGTALCVYQDKGDDDDNAIRMNFTRTNLKASTRLPYTLIECSEPLPKPSVYPIDTSLFNSGDYSEKIDHTRLWMSTFLPNDQERQFKILTWSAFNSRCSKKFNSIKNVGLVAPLLRAPPTQHDALLTSLMRADKINSHYNGPECVTVVGLDLQLFDKAMQLWTTNESINKKFFFIAGQLHTVFWMLQNIGTYIKGSGLPQLWIESGIYSACVVEKMLAGKQMKRAIEAHTTLVLALCNIFISKKIDKHSKKDDIVECIRSVKKVLSIEDDTQFRNAIESVTSTFSSLELDKLFNECGEQSAMETFILNYIKQFEVILQYIRSTRDADIDLHLDSMSKYLKYFFAHNNLSYSRLLPLQLHAYQKIKLENSALWNEFKDNGNFVVTKNDIKFTSIGLDHGLEQEIKKLKIVGGIKGETQKGSSLDRYFTIAPALISIVNQFTEICIDQKIPTKIHHELIGGKSARMVANVGIITDLLNGLEIGLETVDTPLCNVFTKEIVPTNIATDILRRDILGEKQYIDFITDRLVNGKKSVWEPMKKSNIATFLSTSVSIDPKKAKLKMIKEDCNWFQRFTIASRSRSELDLKDLVSRFEFGAVPRSLFAHDGNLLLATDKSRIVHVLEDMSKSLPVVEVSMCDILIIDGMALLHKIKKGKDIVNCMDLSDLFIKMLRTIGDGFFEIHLVMDRYLDNSLKNQTRAKRATKQARQFVISSNTNIQNVTMKELLSHSKTKRDLIAFLCNQTLQKYWDNRFCVTFGNETQGNFAFHSSLKTHSQEEADTLMVLHASTVEKSSTVIVDSPDTDVLLLLLHFMPYLPDYVLFRTGTAKFRRNINVTQLYHCIGPKLESVIVFHALTGTDMTGKFSGISKEAAFKRFLNAPEDIINKLQVLGDSRQTADSLYENVVPFVCNLYKTPCHTVEDARWYLFLKEAVPEEMPPIRDVLMQHFLRAHYMSMIWKNALNPHYSLPNPCNYGWKSETDRFMPILSNQPLCPPKLQDMVICKSCKTGCDTRRCVCFKVGMPCTEMCGCHLGRNVGCKNLSDIYKNEIEFDESDESDQE